MVINGDVVNNSAKAYAKAALNTFKNMSDVQKADSLAKMGYSEAAISRYKSRPDAFLGDSIVEKFANVILTEGIAGSGKTRGVFDSTVRVIKQIKPDLLDKVFIVNATLKNAEDLMKDLNLSGKAFSSSNKETEHDLVRYFYSDYTPNYKDKVKYVDDKLILDFTLNENLTDLPKVIFIDEVSRYDYV
jgi:hypothetical protein